MSQTFREFYRERHGAPYPGELGEHWDRIMLRCCETAADYIDEVVRELRKERGEE